MFHIITLYDFKFDILRGVNQGLGLVRWCVKVWVSICLLVVCVVFLFFFYYLADICSRDDVSFFFI